ncbi:MAG: glycosyltransferase family 10 [Flavobacteriaceae bacterium]
MRELKINFVDFWSTFIKTDNYFYNLLKQKYNVIIDENPDILFYSSFGKNYLNYNCTRIFYTGENRRPDFSACDFAFTFDYNSNKKHFRLPLYSLFIDYYNMLPHLLKEKAKSEAVEVWKQKTKFCCMVVSNPNCNKRIKFFKMLSKVKQVDSGGRLLNNVGGPVPNKAEFIKDYKFVISFENSSQDGYTTEKILEPIFQDCIPIYWGNKFVGKDFNTKRFVNYHEYKSEDEVIEKVLQIDQDDNLAIEMLMQPTFNPNKITHEEEHIEVLKILCKIIEEQKKPVAQKWIKYIHKMKLFLIKLKKKFLKKNKALQTNE